MDLQMKAKDGREFSKVMFFNYSPDDNPKVDEKFASAANKGTLLNKLNPKPNEVQVNSYDELVNGYEKFCEKFIWRQGTITAIIDLSDVI